ncbi:MAG: S8 family serine peptidase [candidate division KSB1 bacterium]|nr:S8 family serine peptidase [candidate division KSB1 bacterium]MDZ7334321.1 S8 family serine peptidase [candidate division KSB1 bacterium]MDZ7356567.1 S8 family serine peptidase [candidate division KSB1 bacterium]MDZ7400468.1 S8 family serine peptidase [candidate division KSB1 bacterium]
MSKSLPLLFIILILSASLMFGQDAKVYMGDRSAVNLSIPKTTDYVANAIVVKFDPLIARTFDRTLLAQGRTGIRAIDILNQKYEANALVEMFPNAQERYFNGRAINLAGYYRIQFRNHRSDIRDVVAAYQRLSSVLKAELIGIHPVDAIPNDTRFPDQWHLSQSNDHDMDAPEAWDVETGNQQVIVGILDTGVRYFHKDLGGSNASYDNPTAADGNMWINWTEKNGVAGVDDDGNGFVDDWIGWDFVDDASQPPYYPAWPGEDADEPDNDPRDFNGHGTHCAGNVGALNNNNYGTSSPSGGWGDGTRQPYGNGVKVMALRIGWSADYRGRHVYEIGRVRMDFAAQAFYYAANNGAKIVSCSWGSSNSGGLEDAVNYFVANGGLVFKSAGNNGDEAVDYLGGRSDVIAVCATDQNDCLASWSTRGTWVDIASPGVGIMSLYHNHDDPQNDYVATMDGTSMASPLAASVAALIWSQNPSWTASQVKQKLFDTADNIYSLSCNASYSGKMGAGRVNAYNAVAGGQPAPPSISINDISVTEGNSGTVNAVFTVSLSKTPDQEVRVDYATANGSATAGSDYAATSGQLVFPAGGSTTQSITVQVYGDQVVESDETFFVNLSNPVNATIADNQGQCTILNDDVQLSLSINDVTAPEGNSGTTNFNFTVTLSATSSQEVRVDFATANGTATAGSDYVATSGTLIFPVGGSLTQTIAVTVNGDQTVEPDETFYVNLSNPVNAVIADGQGIGTIQNDDVQLTLTINDVSKPEGNSGTTNFDFTVSLNATPNVEVRVDYATANGTATAGSDYVTTSGTLVFSAGGATTKTVTVQVNGDQTVESDETFYVNLSNPVNATITDGQGVGTIQNDDSAGNLMHVNDVKVTKVNVTSRLSYGKAEVQIVDQNGAAVANATVTGQWTEGASGTVSFTTGSNGWGSTQSSNYRNVSRYCFKVTNVTKTDWTYDSASNVENWACSDGSGGLNALPGSNPEPSPLAELEKELDEELAFSHPNPFNSSTTISFYLPEPGNVTVEIYNIIGEKITTVFNREAQAGLNSVQWNGTDAAGASVSSGYYFFRIQFPNGQSVIKKMMMIK